MHVNSLRTPSSSGTLPERGNSPERRKASNRKNHSQKLTTSQQLPLPTSPKTRPQPPLSKLLITLCEMCPTRMEIHSSFFPPILGFCVWIMLFGAHIRHFPAHRYDSLSQITHRDRLFLYPCSRCLYALYFAIPPCHNVSYFPRNGSPPISCLSLPCYPSRLTRSILFTTTPVRLYAVGLIVITVYNTDHVVHPCEVMYRAYYMLYAVSMPVCGCRLSDYPHVVWSTLSDRSGVDLGQRTRCHGGESEGPVRQVASAQHALKICPYPCTE
jgi:hypothetical protein